MKSIILFIVIVSSYSTVYPQKQTGKFVGDYRRTSIDDDNLEYTSIIHLRFKNGKYILSYTTYRCNIKLTDN